MLFCFVPYYDKEFILLMHIIVVFFVAFAAQSDVETIKAEKIRIIEQIGEGGFGEVHHAMHCDWGPVAYKRLTVQFIRPNDR